VLPVIVLLSLILIGCSSQLPRVETSQSYILELRAEYLAAHPEGEFNEHVENGEVVKGMDYLAVLASWGHPARRSKRSDVTEDWVYREVDEETDTWMEFKFTFKHSVLDDWEVARHNGGARELDSTRQNDVLTRFGTPPGKRVPTD
jgi:hypothetical protein